MLVNWARPRRPTAALIALGSLLGTARCAATREAPSQYVAGGHAERGAAAVRRYGCGSCHTIPGVRGAAGEAGPPLTRYARRTYVAGMLPNTAENLVRWIEHPQQVVPGNAMPNLGVTDAEARDIAAYLYTLR